MQGEISLTASEWAINQCDYERWFLRWVQMVDTAALAEDDMEMRDIYGCFDLSGDILDVGGFPGTLLTQLSLSNDRYTVVDPMMVPWEVVAREAPGFAERYPFAAVRHVKASAEELPFPALSFDVVNIRSALDHFADPALALLEARRVLRPNGRLIVGNSLRGAAKRGDHRETILAFASRLPLLDRVRRNSDHHTFHPTRRVLRQMITAAGFVVEQEIWQPSYRNVVYIEARTHA